MKFVRGQDIKKTLRIGKAGYPHLISGLSEGEMYNGSYQPTYLRRLGLPSMFAHAFLETIEKEPFHKELTKLLRMKDPRKVYLHSGTSDNISMITQFAGNYIEFEGKLYMIPIEYKDPQQI